MILPKRYPQVYNYLINFLLSFHSYDLHQKQQVNILAVDGIKVFKEVQKLTVPDMCYQ